MFFKGVSYFLCGVILLHLSFSYATPSPNKALTRVVGGSKTVIRRFPYLVQVWLGSQFICGGSLIAPRFVVSAAHCFPGIRLRQLTVVGGVTRLSDNGVRRNVHKMFKKPAFNGRTMDQDIAVLKLVRPMRGPNIRPIPLNNRQVVPGMVMQVTGWGLLAERGARPANIMRTTKVVVVAKETCANQYQNEHSLTDSMFCAAKPRRDACQGDSGGPAVCNGRLCGIVSFGMGCARPNYPGVYTDIFTQLPMIRRALRR